MKPKNSKVSHISTVVLSMTMCGTSILLFITWKIIALLLFAFKESLFDLNQLQSFANSELIAVSKLSVSWIMVSKVVKTVVSSAYKTSFSFWQQLGTSFK